MHTGRETEDQITHLRYDDQVAQDTYTQTRRAGICQATLTGTRPSRLTRLLTFRPNNQQSYPLHVHTRLSTVYPATCIQCRPSRVGQYWHSNRKSKNQTGYSHWGPTIKNQLGHIYIETEKQGSLWLLCTAPCRKDLVWCHLENV